jgi:enoyl-CoA hydratase/carnithine racemase
VVYRRAMTSDRVIVSIEQRVAHVRMNRPDKRNALDLPMFEALAETGEGLRGESGVRAVVLSGEGKAFCAGLDWPAFMASGEGSARRLLGERDAGGANLAQRVCRVWAELPMPVLAAVHGAALGGGLQIALGADLRYVHPFAQLSIMEVRYGLVPDMGLSTLLHRLVRADVARELALTGRVISGEEAARVGLATRTCDDPLAEAMETARGIAARSPRAVRAVKRLLNESPTLDVGSALRLETELQQELIGSAEQMEAAQAVFEKREARFDDP